MVVYITGYRTLFGWTIEVWGGTECSKVHQVENGAPKGSVCSPVLFNIMINKRLSRLKEGWGMHLQMGKGV